MDGKKEEYSQDYLLTLYFYGQEDKIRSIITIKDKNEPLYISIQKEVDSYKKTIETLKKGDK